MATQTTITPHTQQPFVTRVYPSESDLDAIVRKASDAQRRWSKVPLKDRITVGRNFMEEFKKMSDEIPMELTLQMGRPVSQCLGEIRGFLDRADYMLSIAEPSLADVPLVDTDKPGFRRFIKRVPLGVVLIIAPWNYPYLVAINSVLPAIISGNSILLKPSPQTPLTAERFSLALSRAGLPEGVVQVIHLSPELTAHVIRNPIINFVSFTGSVSGGHAVAKAAADAIGFTGVALELGGKDPAYVRPDADLKYTVAELVDGAFFNSGQSCCAIERIYVHSSVYDDFVQQYVDLVKVTINSSCSDQLIGALYKTYRLGDPTDSQTNLGPVVSLASAERIRKQVSDAIQAGAKALVPAELFPAAKLGTTFVAPQVLINVDHTMDIMKEESFGPVVGIQKVFSDEEAIKLMNDSPYGLTASIWTKVSENVESEAAFHQIANELEMGTVFLNRCDYLDPALAWTGVKDSGRGVSLSKFGYDQLTQAKSIHMKFTM
ncbi:succinate semialdehyde dehydrogenase [Pluteus cervinus]|uniref:Succinate semialdehyde dehydrogenase n=1 Tax=Pluteus cervinus TaxID=181527 RepID=A0ACD3AN58_9AGAR|nr:succinate semialdehyde dehydrogenase [Pluteus cervinus]